MRTSEALDQIAPALVKAQAAMKPIKKDGANPHFKSRFITLDAILEAALPALHANGLFLTQGSDQSDDHAIAVVSRIIHVSGQWIETGMRLPFAKLDPQGAGSAMSYGKRYSLAALLAISADDDDDGEATMGRSSSVGTTNQTKPEPQKHLAAPAQQTHVRMTDGVPSGCPQCGGEFYDNRENKKNPKAPDFRCKSATCKDASGKFAYGWWVEKDAKPKTATASGGGPGAPGQDGPEPEQPWDDSDENLPF